MNLVRIALSAVRKIQRKLPTAKAEDDFVIHAPRDLWYKSSVSVRARKGSPEKRFIILVSFPPGASAFHPEELARKVGTSLREREIARHSIVWHLPAAELTEKCAPVIRDRMERFGDSIVPMGLTGAPHRLLHVEEIACDIEWSRSNLWNTGVSDALHVDTAIIIPRSTDFLRSKALETYGSAAVPVGMLGAADDGLWIGIAPRGLTASGGLPVVEAATIDEPTRRTLLRTLSRRQRSAKSLGGDARPVVLRCRVANEEDIERLAAVLSAAAEATAKPGWRIEPLDIEAAAGPPPVLIAAEVPSLAPAVALAVTELRRRRTSMINTRRILEHFAAAPVPEPPPTPPRSSKRGERDFIASMMGQTSIPGSTMSAHFVGGALCGVGGAEVETRKPRPASSWILTADGRRVEAAMSSCFSFESEISRGLRSECTIVDPETGASARIRTEYSVVGEYDALVATQHTLVEGGDPGDTLMVLGIPILNRDRCAIIGRHRDGSTYDFDVSWKLPEVVLAAEVFEIWDGDSDYTFVPLTAAGHPMPWTATLVTQSGPRIVVGGRYPFGEPSEHHLSFLMIRGDIDGELAGCALAGRLPAAIVEEIAAGTAAELSIRREPQEASP